MFNAISNRLSGFTIMKKIEAFLLLILPVWLFTGIFFLPYAIWSFPLSINWFFENGLLMYRDIIYHHPPLPLFILLGASKILGNTEWMLRIVSYFLALGFCYSVYFLARRIQRNVAVVALFLLVVTFFPIASNFNLEEMLASLFSVLAAAFFFHYRKTRTLTFLITSGACVGAAVMSKQIAVGTIPAMMVVLLYDQWKNKPRVILYNLIKSTLFLVGGIFLIVIPCILYFYLRNGLSDFFYWNIIYNLTVYPKAYAQYSPVADWTEAMKNGLWILLAVVSGIILFFKKKNQVEMRKKLMFLLVATSSFLPALLPSFHTYKFLSMYPYPLLLLALAVVHLTYIKRYMFIVVALAFFIVPLKVFYVDFFLPFFPTSEFIREYGEDAENVMKWLTNNTYNKERVVNLGHHYITTKTRLLPHNKYMAPFPWLLLPFDQSSDDIMADPPRIVIVDNAHIEQFPILNTWPFLQYVKKHYKHTAAFGTYEIFIKR